MKFTGQVRVPEVDHPGVPATILVEEDQTEVFLEGESLGRWSLFDVRAERLVSSAFSLSLSGEEITFIADEPVDFAYKGVDHMAGVWAKYKSMTIPRRVVAVGRSRRGTVPSRITELREAMLLNLQTAGRAVPVMAPIETEVMEPTEPSPWTKRIDAYSSVPEPIDEPEEQAAPEPEPVGEPEPVAETESVVEPEPEPVTETESVVEPEPDLVAELETGADPRLEPVSLETLDDAHDVPELETLDAEDAVVGLIESRSVPLRPGPGLIPRRIERAPDTQDIEGQDWELAWEEPPVYEETYDELPPDAHAVLIEHEPALEQVEPAVTEVVEEVEGVGEVEAVEEVEEANEPVPEESTGSDRPDEQAEEWITITTDESGRRELVMDLGHLEVDRQERDQVEPVGVLATAEQPTSIEPDLELLFAGAPAPEGEKSGLLGAVRSAFARNKTAHQHEFVEAPGGIGIVRQICADCGYISIGISD